MASCIRCDKPDAGFRCSACKKVTYCGAQCQRTDWRVGTHAALCCRPIAASPLIGGRIYETTSQLGETKQRAFRTIPADATIFHASAYHNPKKSAKSSHLIPSPAYFSATLYHPIRTLFEHLDSVPEPEKHDTERKEQQNKKSRTETVKLATPNYAVYEYDTIKPLEIDSAKFDLDRFQTRDEFLLHFAIHHDIKSTRVYPMDRGIFLRCRGVFASMAEFWSELLPLNKTGYQQRRHIERPRDEEDQTYPDSFEPDKSHPPPYTVRGASGKYLVDNFYDRSFQSDYGWLRQCIEPPKPSSLLATSLVAASLAFIESSKIQTYAYTTKTTSMTALNGGGSGGGDDDDDSFPSLDGIILLCAASAGPNGLKTPQPQELEAAAAPPLPAPNEIFRNTSQQQHPGWPRDEYWDDYDQYNDDPLQKFLRLTQPDLVYQGGNDDNGGAAESPKHKNVPWPSSDMLHYGHYVTLIGYCRIISSQEDKMPGFYAFMDEIITQALETLINLEEEQEKAETYYPLGERVFYVPPMFIEDKNADMFPKFSRTYSKAFGAKIQENIRMQRADSLDGVVKIVPFDDKLACEQPEKNKQNDLESVSTAPKKKNTKPRDYDDDDDDVVEFDPNDAEFDPNISMAQKFRKRHYL